MEKKQVIKKIFRTIPFGSEIFSFLFTIYCKSRNKKRQKILSYPFGIFNIELTNHCPMKCTICPRTYNMSRATGHMEFEIFKKAIDELCEVNPTYVKDNRVWLHHFGESLVHPEFDKFIKYASEKGVKTCLSLNPFALNESKSIKLIESNLSLAYFSLDGSDNETFEKIRGIENAFDKSKENLLKFLKLKTERKSKIHVVLSMINFEKNKSSINAMRNFWENTQGIDEFLLKPFETWTGDVEEINKMSGKTIKKKNTIICNNPWETITIAWDGTVVPCCFDYNTTLKLGNIRDQSISEIWNGTEMQKLRSEFISGNIENSICKNCDALYNASGKI